MKNVKKESRVNKSDELTIEDVIQLGGDQVGVRNKPVLGSTGH